jgi:hypothetical protein
LQQTNYVALALLLVAGEWIVTIFHREMIAPLHFKLVENSSDERTSEEVGLAGALACGPLPVNSAPFTAIKARLFTKR